jgi:hypothetical protein
MITTSKRKLSRSSAKIRASRAFGRGALVASVIGVAPLFIGASPMAAAAARDGMGGPQCGGTSSGAGTAEPTGPPTGKIRVANFYLNAKGSPGPTLDFYDTSRPSKSDKALISGLKYGEISGYVSPRAAGPLADFTGADYAQLYIFQHGCKTFGGKVDGLQDGNNITQTGWVHGQQETLVLGDDDGLQPYVSSTDIAEVEPKKDDTGQSMIITPPHGKGVLVADVFGLIEGTGKYGGVDLRIDGSCPDNILVGGQQASNSNNSTTPAALTDYSAANFPLPYGSHTLNLVAEPGPGSGLTQQQCNKAPSVATTTVKLSASPPVIVFFYGTDPHHVKVLVTTIG